MNKYRAYKRPKVKKFEEGGEVKPLKPKGLSTAKVTPPSKLHKPSATEMTEGQMREYKTWLKDWFNHPETEKRALSKYKEAYKLDPNTQEYWEEDRKTINENIDSAKGFNFDRQWYHPKYGYDEAVHGYQYFDEDGVPQVYVRKDKLGTGAPEHEYMHASGAEKTLYDAMKARKLRLQKQYLKGLKSSKEAGNLEADKKAIKDFSKYVSSPAEVYPFLMQTRKRIGANPGDTFTPKQIEGFKKKYSRDFDPVLQYLPTETIQEMLNTWVSKDQPTNPNIQMAANGGYVLPKYPHGGEHKEPVVKETNGKASSEFVQNWLNDPITKAKMLDQMRKTNSLDSRLYWDFDLATDRNPNTLEDYQNAMLNKAKYNLENTPYTVRTIQNPGNLSYRRPLKTALGFLGIPTTPDAYRAGRYTEDNGVEVLEGQDSVPLGVHEYTHATGLDSNIPSMSGVLAIPEDKAFDTLSKDQKYLYTDEERYAHTMELRARAGLTPKDTDSLTLEDVEKMRENHSHEMGIFFKEFSNEEIFEMLTKYASVDISTNPNVQRAAYGGYILPKYGCGGKKR